MLRAVKYNSVFIRYFGSELNKVRVRFAPSPTGFLHLGGLRTALFNFLYARKYNGKFILRIEDTDQKRIKPFSVENLYLMLKWTGLVPDESSEKGGPFAPYFQSQRLDKYKEKAEGLIKAGAAYRCFCSETRLNILKKEALRNRESRGYDNKCRHLEPSEVDQLLLEGKPFTIRFKVPKGEVSHEDIVFGRQTHDISESEGDFVIMKSDGFPTYHFACVVDDHLMEISHVLRGTEWLISTPKHLMLYEALGWNPPKFAHLPLLLNSDGTKLSKRQESIGVEYFKEKRYAPNALLSFLTSAGGGFGKQEGCIAYDLDTLCSKFNLEEVNTGSCIVDFRKLDLFSHDHLVKQMSDEKTFKRLIEEFRGVLKEKYGERYEKERVALTDAYIKDIMQCYQDRMHTLSDLITHEMEYLWTKVEWDEVDQKLKELKTPESILDGLADVIERLNSETNYEISHVSVILREISAQISVSYSSLMRTLRVILTGQKDGPGVAEILSILGKKRSLEKLVYAGEMLQLKKEQACKS